MSLIPTVIDTNLSSGKSKLSIILWSEYCTKYSFFNIYPPLGFSLFELLLLRYVVVTSVNVTINSMQMIAIIGKNLDFILEKRTFVRI